MANSGFGLIEASGATPIGENGLGWDNYGYSAAGDWFTGSYGAREQATRQSIADYKEWLRNEYSAKQQRDFELWMDSTKTQRAMADIKAAGLNPWLALQSAGFGGSVPSGAAASSSAGQMSTGTGNSGLAAIGTTAVGLAALIKILSKIVK